MPTARDRYYSAPPATHNLAFGHVWSPTAVITGSANPITGAWIPPSASADGYINVNAGIEFTGALNATIGAVAVTGGSITVNNTAPIPVSGVVLSTAPAIQAVSGITQISNTVTTTSTIANALLATSGTIQGGNSIPLNVTGIINTVVTGAVSASFDTTSIVNAQATGNQRLLVDNLLLSGISGQLGGTLTTTATISNAVLATSGVQTIGNTAPIPTSGVVQVGNTVTTNSTVVNPLIATSGNATIINTAPIPFSGVTQSNVTNALLATSGISTIGNTAPIPVSGVVQASVSIGNVAVTGGSINVANTAPIPVSGVVQTSVSISNVAVTGFPSTIAPLAISGIVTTSATIGNVAITGFTSTIAPLAVSGVFNATTDNTTVVVAIASGNNIELSGNSYLLVANQLLSGISGSLTSNLTSAAWVTGQVSLTNTAPIAVSGVVQSTAPALQAISGNTTIINTAPIPFSGVVQANVTNTVTTNATIQNTLLAVSGNTTILNTLLAISGNTVTQVTGFNSGIVVSTQPVTKAAVSNSTPSGASPWTSLTTITTGQIFAANPSRVMFFIQNISTGVPLYISYSTNAASTGNFNFILNPSANAGWGGSSFSDDHWRGPVTASGGGWVNWEL